MSLHKLPQRAALPKGLLAPACPRDALAAAVHQVNDPQVNFASLSRMIDKRDGYLGTFVREGHPLALGEREHRMLANFFGVSERGLGIRELWVPMEDAT